MTLFEVIAAFEAQGYEVKLGAKGEITIINDFESRMICQWNETSIKLEEQSEIVQEIINDILGI